MKITIMDTKGSTLRIYYDSEFNIDGNLMVIRGKKALTDTKVHTAYADLSRFLIEVEEDDFGKSNL